MSQVVLEIPEESLVALDGSPAVIAEELRVAAAVKLYELGRLSSGAAALLSGLPRVVFLSRLAEYGVDTFRQTKEELASEQPTGRLAGTPPPAPKGRGRWCCPAR
jgi:predicted HTH domain antitoxin